MNRSGDSPHDRLRAVEAFPPSLRADIDAMLDRGGYLPAESVLRITDQLGIGIETLMVRLLPVAQLYSVAPVSRFRVGAVAAGMPEVGSCGLYLGANFELPDCALSFTVHAEQAATNHAWLSGATGIQSLAVSAAPCGYCRQFLNELTTAGSLSILLPASGDRDRYGQNYTSRALSSYLPDAFGPGDLGISGGLMAAEPGQRQLALTDGPSDDPLVATALAAACLSYAPYPTRHSPDPVAARQAFAGVALELDDGSSFAGRHAENAAFNPSLSPLQSALAFMNLRLPLSARREIRRCVLVEVPAGVSQRSFTQVTLAACAPGVELEYWQASVP